MRLLYEELLVIAKKVGFDFSYAYDVLLPEVWFQFVITIGAVLFCLFFCSGHDQAHSQV